MSVLSDKVCIVTGASSGIGEATAIELGKRGANLVLAARRADRLESLAKQIVKDGGHAVAVECDVVDRSQVQTVVDTAMKDFGRIDVVINNAGIMPLAPMVKCRMDDWDAMIDINIKGLLYGIGLTLPVMLKQNSGHIINVSSVAGRRLFPNGCVYCGTKHAVHAISEGLRQELAEMHKDDGNKIRVSVIAPGVVTTELPDSIRDDETREQASAYYGSIAGPLLSEDIAASIVYCLEAPPHVDVNEVLIRPTAQMPIPRLKPDDTALLVIDVQERLLPTIVDAQKVVDNCAILVRLATELELPYMVTEQYPRGLGRTAEPITSAMSDPSRRIEKTRFSAAIDMVVGGLNEVRRGTVLIAGLEAHVCVLQTVLDLQGAGYQCFVCCDAVSAGQREQIAPAYERMRRAGGIVTGVMSAMYELLGDARHASFNRCLDLAKAVSQ